MAESEFVEGGIRRMSELSNLESRIQELETQKEKIAARLKREKAKLRSQASQARKRRLYQVGALAEKARLLDVDDEALLGAMMEIKMLLGDGPTFQMLQSKGASLILGEAQLLAPTSQGDRSCRA
jgi:predicted phage tail protein